MRYLSIGGEFIAKTGLWVGAKVGLFAIRGGADGRPAHADVDWFRIEPIVSR